MPVVYSPNPLLQSSWHPLMDDNVFSIKRLFCTVLTPPGKTIRQRGIGLCLFPSSSFLILYWFMIETKDNYVHTQVQPLERVYPTHSNHSDSDSVTRCAVLKLRVGNGTSSDQWHCFAHLCVSGNPEIKEVMGWWCMTLWPQILNPILLGYQMGLLSDTSLYSPRKGKN